MSKTPQPLDELRDQIKRDHGMELSEFMEEFPDTCELFDTGSLQVNGVVLELRVVPAQGLPWPKHKPQATLHDVILDGVTRDLKDDQIISETNSKATPTMTAFYRKALAHYNRHYNKWKAEQDANQRDLQEGSLNPEGAGSSIQAS